MPIRHFYLYYSLMKSLFNLPTIQTMLKLAGLYNILWGVLVIIFPEAIFKFLEMPLPNYLELWQCIGMIVGVYGVGYFIAAQDPETHWPIILVGFLGKIFGPIGFIKALLIGSFPLKFLGVIVLNDLVWLIPFYYALIYAYEAKTSEESAPKKFTDLIKLIKTNHGESLYEASLKSKVLLVFIRHFGCTFCRETVFEISKLDSQIKVQNLNPIFVHMSDPSFGDEFFAKYYTYPVTHISDPQRYLYKSLNLKRGSLSQLFGPKTWIRGFWAGIFKGHGKGELEGDPLQLGGFFVLSHGQVVYEHKNKSASEFFELSALPKL